MEDTLRNFRMLELKSYRILTYISYTVSIIITLKMCHYKISIFTMAQDCKLHFNIILHNFQKNKNKKVLKKILIQSNNDFKLHLETLLREQRLQR